MLQESKYMPQLDSLRAFAIFSVMLVHWLPEDFLIQKTFVGNMGLKMFFVLSGFLITKILVQNKQKITEKKITVSRYFKQFYIRRTLRIFPVYYATLLIIYILDVFPVRESWQWHATYMSNWFLYFKGDWYGWTSHFWTLSVEEQFYLLWPIVILVTPISRLKLVLYSTILLSVVFKLFCYYNNVPLIEILTPSCFDAFAIGGILAHQSLVLTKEEFKKHYLLSNPLFFVGIIGYAFLILINHTSDSGWLGSNNLFWEVFHSAIGAIIFVFIIAKASVGFSGITGKILENKLLIYLGKVSYSSYIFHELMPQLADWLYQSIGVNKPQDVYVNFGVYFILTIALSTLSWYVLESPMLKLKRKFSY
jgi:peptidoglycan/LPS O-acetylase OafA/YrhL